MKKFIKKNIPALLALLVVMIIVVSLAIRNSGNVTYKANLNEALGMLSHDKGEISPVELLSILQDKSKTVIPVDIRSEIEFSRGHIEGAVNIPTYDLLGKRSLKFFKKLTNDNGTAVLYAGNQSDANGAYMLLKQVGVKNLSILQGGYDIYSKMPLPDSLLNVKIPMWASEVCKVDTLALKAPKVEKQVTAPKPVQEKPKKAITPVKKEESSGGGC